ncbi:MAG: TRAP transporter small permease [Planctomycetes bacterium]|nr:TRAP transporter small permease [Planctomycetota bacterium]
MALLRKFNDLLTRALDFVIVLGMVGMVVFVFAQVIWRYVLRQPLSWSEELSRYLFSVVTLFGAVILFRESKHINMSLVTDRLKSPVLRNLLRLFANLCSLVFLVVVIWYAWPMTMMILEFEVVSYSMEWLKMGWIFMMLPIASLLACSMLVEVILSGIIALRREDG